MYTCTEMKAAVETILQCHGLLGRLQQSEFAVRIANPPFLPLTIERHDRQIMITHYYQVNGDMIPDPDMEFELVEGRWEPVALQLCTGHYYRAVEYVENERHVNHRQAKKQRDFAKLWARNLLDQGYEKGTVHVFE